MYIKGTTSKNELTQFEFCLSCIKYGSTWTKMKYNILLGGQSRILVPIIRFEKIYTLHTRNCNILFLQIQIYPILMANTTRNFVNMRRKIPNSENVYFYILHAQEEANITPLMFANSWAWNFQSKVQRSPWHESANSDVRLSTMKNLIETPWQPRKKIEA